MMGKDMLDVEMPPAQVSITRAEVFLALGALAGSLVEFSARMTPEEKMRAVYIAKVASEGVRSIEHGEERTIDALLSFGERLIQRLE